MIYKGFKLDIGSCASVLFSCPPEIGLSVIVELLSSTASGSVAMESRAWTKLVLFEDSKHLLTGRWRLPLQRLPVESDSSSKVGAASISFFLHK